MEDIQIKLDHKRRVVVIGQFDDDKESFILFLLSKLFNENKKGFFLTKNDLLIKKLKASTNVLVRFLLRKKLLQFHCSYPKDFDSAYRSIRNEKNCFVFIDSYNYDNMSIDQINSFIAASNAKLIIDVERPDQLNRAQGVIAIDNFDVFSSSSFIDDFEKEFLLENIVVNKNKDLRYFVKHQDKKMSIYSYLPSGEILSFSEILGGV